MTEKLYLARPQDTQFTARVTAHTEVDGRPACTLERTLFYPTAGGQPNDTGHLEGPFGRVDVIDVVKAGGDIHHLLGGDLPAVGTEVRGSIDWPRRFSHMQRHTAQHLLSQAFFRLDPRFRTVSVSFMGPLCTVDFEGDPDREAARAAQALVNHICYRDLPITDFEIPDSRLGEYSLRRAPKVSGLIRLVAAGDWELAACGAPHLASTAQAAPIKIQRLDRIKGSLVRVTYQAGLEALADYDLKHDLVHELSVSFSAQPEQLGARIQGLRDDLAAQREINAGLSLELRELKLDAALGDAPEVGGVRLVSMSFEAHEEQVLKKVMRRFERERRCVFLGQLHRADKLEVTLLRTPDLPHSAGQLVRAMLTEIPGRGGGRDDMARFATELAQATLLEPLLRRLLEAQGSSGPSSSSPSS